MKFGLKRGEKGIRRKLFPVVLCERVSAGMAFVGGGCHLNSSNASDARSFWLASRSDRRKFPHTKSPTGGGKARRLCC